MEELSAIATEINNCKRCGLWKFRTNSVPGEGPANPKIMFIGEAPGRNEDLQGRPFVGRAGKLLDELLNYIGVKRNEVFIGNILKDRPPQNRNPQPEEIKACTPFLDMQLEILKPKIICTLGNFSSAYILEKFGHTAEPISKVHGKSYKVKNLFLDLVVIPLYHPAAAIYNPNLKATLMEDFRVIKDFL